MNTQQAFEVLQIEYTTDKRKIKQAYAKLVKQHHPEVDPEGWAMLRSAFEIAAAYAKHGHSDSVWKEEQEDARTIHTAVRTGGREYKEDIEYKTGQEKKEEYEYQEISEFFHSRMEDRKKSYIEAEDLVLAKLRNMHDTQSVSANDWYRVFAMPEMYMVRTSFNVLTAIRDRLEVQLPPEEICSFLRNEMRKIGDQIQRMPDTDAKSRLPLMRLIGEIESCLNVSDRKEKQEEVSNQSPKKENDWLERIGFIVLPFLLVLVPVGLSCFLGWMESRKESSPEIAVSQEQVHVYEHYVPEAEEAFAGARIGDPQAEKENIIRLYNKIYNDDEFEIQDIADEHHLLLDRSNYIPEEFTIPDNCKWICALCALSIDGETEDVIICAALKEYGFEKDGFAVYEYDEDQGAYLAEKITYLSNWNGNPEGEIVFPYVYQDVLYMRVNEYKSRYEGQKYLTIIAQTKE